MFNQNLNENLLVGQGKKQAKEYQRKIQECQQKVKILKNKNNELEKQSRQSLERDIRQAIKQQNDFLDKQIQDLRRILQGIGRQYTNPAAKNKLKELWKDAAKQIERNKIIMGQFINRQSSGSFLKRQQQQKRKRSDYSKESIHGGISKTRKSHSSSLVQQQIMDDGDLNMQIKIEKERNLLLRELEEKNNNINRIMNEMGNMVGGEQKDLIYDINDNMVDALNNVEKANEQLYEARKEQKKARKKYVILAIIIIIIVIVIAGLIYLFL